MSNLAKLQKSFATACQGFQSPDFLHYATEFTDQITILLQAEADTETVLNFLERSFASELPFAADVLESAIGSSLSEICKSSDLSVQIKQAVRRLLSKYATTSNARDTATIFAGHIASARAPLGSGDAILIMELPTVLARLQKQHLRILKDVLDAMSPVLRSIEGTWVGHLCNDDTNTPGEETQTETVSLLVTLFSQIAQAVDLWPENVHAEAKSAAASSLLLLFSAINFDIVPLNVHLHSVHLAVGIHFQQPGSVSKRQAASRLARRFLTILKQYNVASITDLLHISESRIGGDAAKGPRQVAKAVLLFCALCCPQCSDILEDFHGGRALLSSTPLVLALLQSASEAQSICAAQKALAIIVAACPSKQAGGVPFDDNARLILDCLVTTMTQTLDQQLRNCATHAFNALLASMQARAHLEAVNYIHSLEQPGVSAYAIQALLRFAEQAWPGPAPSHLDKREKASAGGLADWEVLQTQLLSMSLDWINPSAKHSAVDASSMQQKAEPICAALNLYRFLLIKERSDGTNYTGVRDDRHAKHVCRNALQPLQTLTNIAIQELSTVNAEGSPEGLALARVLEVLSRVLEVAENY